MQCTTSSVKGPVATLDAAVSSIPPRIRVFETLLVQDTRPQLDRGGVSLNLLDHLLVTALLLVTEPEEWITHARPASSPVARMDSIPKSAPASVRQWRKMVYGDPLFPSLRSPSGRVAEPIGDIDEDFRPSSPANRPASMRQLRKIVFGEPLFPSLSQEPPEELEFASRSSSPGDDGSQSSDSINYPATPLSIGAPNHGYLDPSFYETDIPPVPELPQQYKPLSPSRSLRILPPRPHTSSASAASSPITRRELPRPPVPTTPTASAYSPVSPLSLRSDQQWLHRSRSTPFLQGNSTAQSMTLRPPHVYADRRPPSSLSSYPSSNNLTDISVPSSSGSRRRQLPQVPTIPSTPHMKPTRPTIQTSKPRSEKSRPASRPTSHTSSLGRSLPQTPDTTASGSGPSRGQLSAQEQMVRQSMEKEAEELADWVRSLTPEQQRQHHQREATAVSHGAVFDAPPPAYNAIDFSHPPCASAPSSSSTPSRH